MVEYHWIDFPQGIPQDLWGRDHESTMLYAESRAVDARGKLKASSMRVSFEYPTRLSDGSTVQGHTDYACLLDAQAVGLLSQVPEEGDQETPVVFTDAGWAYAHGLRRARAERSR